MLHFLYTPYTLRHGAYETYEFSNNEIVKYAQQFFAQVTPTHIDTFQASCVTDRAEDILLGHPTWDPEYTITNNWVKDNALSAQAACHPNTYILMPWLPKFPAEWHMPFVDEQLVQARQIFAICGDIWIDQTRQLNGDSIQSRVKDKLVQVNMGCAAHLLPCKKTFARKSRRNLLHISNLGSTKNIPLIFRSTRGLDVTVYMASFGIKKTGNYEINLHNDDGTQTRCYFESLGPIDNNDARMNRFIIDTCDFYIHTSTYDAQATSILENCARGLVPLVTPESGFDCPHAIKLTQDPEANKTIIHRAVTMSDEEFATRSRGVRQHILDHHNWQHIYRQIWEHIQQDLITRQDNGGKILNCM